MENRSKMRLYKIVVDLSGPGDFIVVAEDEEKAVNCIRPLYIIELDEDDYSIEELSDLTEELVYELP